MSGKVINIQHVTLVQMAQMVKLCMALAQKGDGLQQVGHYPSK